MSDTLGDTMMKILSVKMDEKAFETADTAARRLGMPRNAYINRAVKFFNRLYQRKLLQKELAKESRLVSQESQAVLKEFEALEDSFP